MDMMMAKQMNDLTNKKKDVGNTNMCIHVPTFSLCQQSHNNTYI
jgi:hypothetical protein